MKAKNVISNILFWITLFSPIISFYLAGLVGETEIFGVFGLVRYSWIMLLFLPIPALTLSIAIVLKKHNKKYKKNLIVCFICLPLLIVFGSYRVIFRNDISYEASTFVHFGREMKIDLPNNVKVATGKVDSYLLGYAKIQDEKQKNEFERVIINSDLWESKFTSPIRGSLPIDIQYRLVQFDYFSLYDSTSGDYNLVAHEGDEIFFIAYSYEGQRFMFLRDYIIQ